MQLVACASAGDNGAFATLYERYAGRVLAQLTRVLGSGPDCEDVLQQVFAALHHALPRFRGDSQLSTFLHRIAANVATDHLRARGRRAVAEPLDLDKLLDGNPTPAERAQRRAQLRQVFALLERITPAKRAAFVLVAIEGLSHEQAAVCLGGSVAKVKQRVLRARRELMKLMAKGELNLP